MVPAEKHITKRARIKNGASRSGGAAGAARGGGAGSSACVRAHLKELGAVGTNAPKKKKRKKNRPAIEMTTECFRVAVMLRLGHPLLFINAETRCKCKNYDRDALPVVPGPVGRAQRAPH